MLFSTRQRASSTERAEYASARDCKACRVIRFRGQQIEASRDQRRCTYPGSCTTMTAANAKGCSVAVWLISSPPPSLSPPLVFSHSQKPISQIVVNALISRVETILHSRLPDEDSRPFAKGKRIARLRVVPSSELENVTRGDCPATGGYLAELQQTQSLCAPPCKSYNGSTRWALRLAGGRCVGACINPVSEMLLHNASP